MSKPDKWHDCYGDQWGDDIVPAAFSHPAKASKALIFRILDHCIANGWLRPGDTVVDPFGGIGTTALPCLLKGVNVVTCELEPKFHEWQEQNAELWQRRYAAWPAFQRAQWTRLKGDSRQLVKMVSEAKVCVSSPPYADQTVHDGTTVKRDEFKEPGRTGKNSQAFTMNEYGRSEGQLGNMKEGNLDAAISSPPYADSINSEKHGIDFSKAKKDYPGRVMHEERLTLADKHHSGRCYGATEGQLGAMKEGELDAAISSPPFVQTHGGGRGINVEGYQGRDRVEKVGDRTFQGINAERQPENLETMREGDVDLALSSPPYANIATGAGGLNTKPPKNDGQQSGRSAKAASQDTDQKYGQTDGQLAAMPDNGFDAAVGSPPFERGAEGTLKSHKVKFVPSNGKGHYASPEGGGGFDASVTSPPYETGGHHQHQMDAWNKNGGGQTGQVPGYPEADAFNKLQQQTFWMAARAIVEQTFTLLKPGGHAIWITKNFVRSKQEVDFNANWRALCESVGFKTVCIHHAMLVENRGTNLLLDGGEHTDTRQRKSFFRRLAEAKGSPPIDFECVSCMVKP